MKTKRDCPFCGENSVNILSPKTVPQSTHGKGYQVECFECGARGPLGYVDKKNAILGWEYQHTPQK